MTSLLLSDLPIEVLWGIFAHLSSESLFHLFSTCKKLCILTKHIVFKSLKISWARLDDFLDLSSKNLIDIAPFVLDIYLSDANLWSEWHKNDELGRLLSMCHNTKSVNLFSSSSSSWLKYVSIEKKSTIPKVTLCSKKSSNFHSFNTTDLVGFSRLSSLELQGFSIASITNIPSLSKLTLRDCSWDYPLEIEHISQNLTSLAIIVSPDHCYLSNFERIRSIAQSPPLNIVVLKLHFLSDPIRYVPWVPLTNSKHCTKLKSIDLKGFDLLPPSFFCNIPSSVSSVTFHYKDLDSDYVNRIKSKNKYIKITSKSNQLLKITL